MKLYERVLDELDRLADGCDEPPLKADGLDEAIVGISDDTRLIYAKELCVRVVCKRDGMDGDAAREFLEFNTYPAFVGPMTPIWADFEDDVIEFFAKANSGE